MTKYDNERDSIRSTIRSALLDSSRDRFYPISRHIDLCHSSCPAGSLSSAKPIRKRRGTAESRSLSYFDIKRDAPSFRHVPQLYIDKIIGGRLSTFIGRF
ncbi:hypothetical protein NDA11_001530 [Ustilago hordei]|uniref:Uncharacterized protein n=1 Tax=Ustilago hordei TaxID=120017 RepID=I2FQK5_USTHO|nr:uncharacterized protein UHO2_05233 [Ustilago hordei]KAJ1042883.1 hypothetical protein NDA10_000026 [Ustilago hordei]KAJ1571258.1 hypothetical protein NDA12_003974 [Ustilago hordei]KAJ1571368.1 hypothetical protein NDA15_000180 [Ustilago hordei]KAJ1595995.1 hypothetical protein NDA11_001530 [Ustilago hordei]KAJ1596782.1 hypothetical protein NDA14_006870 [Ustilago hordei]